MTNYLAGTDYGAWPEAVHVGNTLHGVYGMRFRIRRRPDGRWKVTEIRDPGRPGMSLPCLEPPPSELR